MNAKKTHRDFIEQLRSLYSHNEAIVIADWVFESVTGWKKSAILTQPDLDIGVLVYEQLQEKLAALLLQSPVQYVLEEAWFYKRRFHVTPAVLIPRPETEELVEWVIEDLKAQSFGLDALHPAPAPGNATAPTILDIGTGSGCIAITLKKEWPDANVIAVEYSKAALEIARHNAAAQEAEITWLHLDFLNENNWDAIPTPDLIISNPPYIPQKDKRTLDPNVALYEPDLALFVPDETPLLFYEKIGRFAKQRLQPGSFLYVETHEEYTRAVDTLYKTIFSSARSKKDLFNNSRMVKAIN
jgi:release factor glutamine methyltransferase